MPTYDIIFIIIAVLIPPMAFLLVNGAALRQNAKEALALDAGTKAATDFMYHLEGARRQSNANVLKAKVTLKITEPPAFYTIPRSMRNHKDLGQLQTFFCGGRDVRPGMALSAAALMLLIYLGFKIGGNTANWASHAPYILGLICCCAGLLFFAVYLGLEYIPVILFYEHGLVFIEKRTLAKLHKAFQSEFPYNEIYTIDFEIKPYVSRYSQFWWTYRFCFHKNRHFSIKESDFKSLYQMINCLQKAEFEPVIA